MGLARHLSGGYVDGLSVLLCTSSMVGSLHLGIHFVGRNCKRGLVAACPLDSATLLKSDLVSLLYGLSTK